MSGFVRFYQRRFSLASIRCTSSSGSVFAIHSRYHASNCASRSRLISSATCGFRFKRHAIGSSRSWIVSGLNGCPGSMSAIGQIVGDKPTLFYRSAIITAGCKFVRPGCQHKSTSSHRNQSVNCRRARDSVALYSWIDNISPVVNRYTTHGWLSMRSVENWGIS